MALNRIPMLTPCYSDRQGATVRLIVIHTAEGSTTIESLANWFKNPSHGVSSHVGADDKVNTVGEYVRRRHKAWTCASFNPVAVQLELCARAAWTTAQWDKHPNMLDNCAKWIAEEAKVFNLPITRLSPSQAQGSGRGVCQHIDLGIKGGGHVDCGGGFPMDRVLDMARGSQSETPAVPAPPSSKAPTFPFRQSDYLGVPDGSTHWHDGHGGGYDSQEGVRPWQQQMAKRGWSISVDGVYGSESQAVCKQFQAEKKLAVDGRVGPQTWAATWEAPVT